MNKKENCPCGKGAYKYGSGLYDYYTCGHAYEKPLNNTEDGRFVCYQSPYEKENESHVKLESI